MQENEKEMYLQYINAISADVRSFRRLHMQKLFESRMSHVEIMTMCMIQTSGRPTGCRSKVGGFMDEPLTRNTDEPIASSTDEPVARSTDEPIARSTDEPVTSSKDEHMEIKADNSAASEADVHSGRIPLAELITKLRQSPQAVSRTIRHLEQMGFVKRMADPDDRRNTYVVLTDAGKEEMERNKKVIDEVAIKIFSRLGLEKCRQLDENLRELRKIVEDEISITHS